jgi:hypothetical protein
VFGIGGFEGGTGPPTHGGSQSSNGALISIYQTSKYSRFGSRNKKFVDVSNSRLGRWNWTPNTWKTLEFDWGHDFKSPNIKI